MSESIRDLATPLAPRAAAKVFTLREFVRLTEHLDAPARASEHAPTRTSEHAPTPAPEHAATHAPPSHAPPAAGHPDGSLGWLRDEAHLARPHAHRPEGTEDVDDPMGRSWDRWVEMGRTLDELIGRVVELASAPPSTSTD